MLRLALHGSDAPPPLPAPAVAHRVVRIVDGITFEIDGDVAVRLLGIDPHPSTDGSAATKYLASLLAGRTVQLEYDLHRRDRSDRVLAYVSVDGRCINEEVLRAGHGRPRTETLLRSDLRKRFEAAAAEARAAGLGPWEGGGNSDATSGSITARRSSGKSG